MKKSRLAIVLLGLVIGATVACVMLLGREKPTVDIVMLNEIRASVEAGDYAQIDTSEHEVIVIGLDGGVRFSGGDVESRSYDEWLNFAHKNDWVILEFSDGRILVEKPSDNLVQLVVVVLVGYAFLVAADMIAFWYMMHISVISPFNKLKEFATEVAAGNLDAPILMDKKNAFGAFTESFDLMREELKRAKEKEIELEKSKTELVASLSHDIKTPIASIKAVAELLTVSEVDQKKLKNLDIIQRKAGEIDLLITDMFNVALQDLSELKICVGELESYNLEAIIREADYLGKLNEVRIPDCLIVADTLRLKQVVGNIINNSYKYAGTEIALRAQLEQTQLVMEFRDFGGGVEDEELPLLFNKFYRGTNSDKKSGAGLGLFICRELLQKMGGKIDCYNTEDGFAAKISLRLA